MEIVDSIHQAQGDISSVYFFVARLGLKTFDDQKQYKNVFNDWSLVLKLWA